MVREASGKGQFTARPERADRGRQPKITSRKVKEGGENKCGLLYYSGWASLPEDTLGLDNREISLLWEDEVWSFTIYNFFFCGLLSFQPELTIRILKKAEEISIFI